MKITTIIRKNSRLYNSNTLTVFCIHLIIELAFIWKEKIKNRTYSVIKQPVSLERKRTSLPFNMFKNTLLI